MAVRQLAARRRQMLPGSRRDGVLTVAKWALPGLSLVILAAMVLLPASMTRDFSFLLSKDSAARADERMRMQEATYRGETSQGEAFSIRAQSGVQKTSSVPVVLLRGLAAEISQADGPARVTAPAGEFFIEENRLVVRGPVVARSESGYSVDGNDIEVDINAKRVTAAEPVSGQLPMGSFQADSFTADIDGRHVRMEGGVKLRITPNRDLP
ncbi:hypothetical protein ACUJ46_05765 [Sandaracinobacteroides sp. A072]